MVNQKIIQSLPSTIGVYIFYENKIPIYIGKSINIKSRVLSHLANSKLINKEQRLITRATDIKYFITLSEFESLLLEAKLIRKYLPVYNVISRDDKSCLYIKITVKEPYPKVLMVRAENDGRSLYFGPFPSRSITTKIVKYARRIFPFCTNKSISNRACFYSHLGLCNPCPNTIELIRHSGDRYSTVPVDTISYLKLKVLYQKQIKRLVMLLSGKNNRLYQQLERELKQAIAQGDFEEGIKIRNRLMTLQYLNTARFINNYENQQANNKQLTAEINNFFNFQFQILDVSNYRIECYDISNLNFSHATGSMVVFENGQFNTNQYRKFRIKVVNSDAHMLKEVLKRRFNNKQWSLPNLILIDGGKAQLSVISKYFKKNNINIPILAIAKRPDRFYSHIAPISFTKYPHLQKVLVSLRDESHRFAKKYHVLLRNKEFLI